MTSGNRASTSPAPDVDRSTSAPSDAAVNWDELLATHTGAELAFEAVPFDHPLWVLYSSGTTGLSTLWQLAEEHGVTYFGTSAPYIQACLKEGLEPGATHDRV